MSDTTHDAARHGPVATTDPEPWPDALAREKKPAYSLAEALAEAHRCLFCFDAPCTRACPTHIDVPRFIKRIASGNPLGAAATIFSANVLGHSCARVCPTEVLCEGACVLNDEHRPIDIGRLQRHATDAAFRAQMPIVTAGPRRPGSVGIIGGGPAGLACAAELLRLGFAAEIYEAAAEPGGLNTYGVAQYKMTPRVSIEEVRWLERAGLVLRCNVTVGRDISVAALRAHHHALFVGVGMGKIPPLGIAGEELGGVYDALDLIEDLKYGRRPRGLGRDLPGARVVVIGGGNTSIDAVTQALRAGASEALLLYRRGPAELPAYAHEVELLQHHGGRVLFYHQAQAVLGEDGRVSGLRVRRGAGAVGGAGDGLIPCDVVVRATGQKGANLLDELGIESHRGIVKVDAWGRTSDPVIWAGGDCVSGGREVVNAVEDGKRAAQSIAREVLGAVAPQQGA